MRYAQLTVALKSCSLLPATMAAPSQMRDPLRVGKAIRAQLENEVPIDLPLGRDFHVSRKYTYALLTILTLRNIKEGTDYTITDHVNDLHQKLCPTPRTLQVFTSLINHLHAFARETKPTHEEWTTGIKYLTRAGKESTEFKNEFILLSDCLGLSALLDELSHPKPPACTESCEPGPFFTTDAPEIPSGSSVANKETVGESMFFQATIKNTKGERIQGAKAEMVSLAIAFLFAPSNQAFMQWQADGDGLYDVQYPGRTEANDRARIVVKPDGSFNYRGILPTAYPIVRYSRNFVSATGLILN